VHFDYFELVLQWPPAFGSNLGSKVSHWTIHGLWPSRIQNAETYPCQCTQESFRESVLDPIRGTMDKLWPSLKDGNDNAYFWSHEWEKHGTCCAPHMTSQFVYFNTTLALRLRNDPSELLGDLKPSVHPYPFETMAQRLGKNGAVVMHCHNHGSEKQALVELVLCMSASKKPSQFACPELVRQHSTGLCDPRFPINLIPPGEINQNVLVSII
jgi:ribonuclease I